MPDRDGGVLIHDYNGKTTLWRMGLDGGVRATLDARTGDGQPRAEYRRALQVGAGREPLDHGRARVRAPGRPGPSSTSSWVSRPALTGSSPPGFARIDSTFGRLLILDDRTRGALHVFDAEGRRVTLCRHACRRTWRRCACRSG